MRVPTANHKSFHTFFMKGLRGSKYAIFNLDLPKLKNKDGLILIQQDNRTDNLDISKLIWNIFI